MAGKKKPPQQNKNSGCRSFNMQARTVEGEGSERKRIISFSSEEPYERWFGLEILSHADGAMDLTRLNDIGVVLFNHDRNYVIGKINRAWVEDNRGNAEIEFDTDEEAEKIFGKVESGTLKGVSVSYRVDSWEEVAAGKTSADGRFTGPCEIAVKWTPLEISIVSIPADATVGVGRELELPDEYEADKERSIPLDIFERQIAINKEFFKEEKKTWASKSC